MRRAPTIAFCAFRAFCVRLVAALLAQAGCSEPAAFTDPAEAGPDFVVQGEYAGRLARDGAEAEAGLQVIAHGGGAFVGVLLPGGLPGTGREGRAREIGEGRRQRDGVVRLSHPAWTAALTAEGATLAAPDGRALGRLARVVRTSPTLGAPPPPGATVLFDGAGLGAWAKGARASADGLLEAGATSLARFGSARIHVEFRTPFMPTARGQERGNSGVFVQGRYEVQILDSFGLEGTRHEAGAIYDVSAPAVNMALPPLAWQTYDIELVAARFAAGKRVRPALMTVRHNGVLVQEARALPGPTGGAAMGEGEAPGPLHLQDHDDPVRYRNVWVVEGEGEGPGR